MKKITIAVAILMLATQVQAFGWHSLKPKIPFRHGVASVAKTTLGKTALYPLKPIGFKADGTPPGFKSLWDEEEWERRLPPPPIVISYPCGPGGVSPC